jgi:hypothetical protein
MRFSVASMRADDSPIDWNAYKESLRPGSIAEPEWNTLFPLLITRIGSTWRDYHNMLLRNSALIPPEIGANTDPLALIGLEIQAARASLGTSISGRLQTAGFAIDISGQFVRALNRTTRETFVTTSLNDGSFVFESVTPGDYLFDVDNGVTNDTSPLRIEPGRAVTGITVQVQLGSTIRGQVTQSTSGTPIEGAVVTVSNGGNRHSDLRTVTTDSDGRYLISGLRSGTYSLVIGASGRATEVVNGIALTEQSETIVNRLLGEAGGIRATVRQSSSSGAIENAIVTLLRGGTTEPVAVLQSDAEGTVHFTGVAAGLYTVRTTAAGFGAAEITNVRVDSNADTSLTLQLAAAVSVAGRVVNSAGGATGMPGITVNLVSSTNIRVAQAVTQQGGAFSFAAVAPGEYRLEVMAEDPTRNNFMIWDHSRASQGAV